MTVAGYHGLSLRQIKTDDTFFFERDAETITGLDRAILEASTIQEEDLALTPAYLKGNPDARLLVDDEGMRTRLSIPLISGGKAIGAIILSRREVAPFATDQIVLAETFAAQAVIAIENVRQFRELQTRLAREAATREILEVISQSRDDDKPVFEVVLRKAAELCHAPMSSLLIISEDRTHSVLAAEWGHHDVSAAVLKVGETVGPLDSNLALSTCMREGRVIHLHDLADSDLYRSGDPIRTAVVDQEGLRTFLAVPLFSGGQTVGSIAVYRPEVAPFSPDEIALVETFAAQAVIAIENVRQFRAIQTANAELETRLERGAATREILSVISQSRDDDGPVFEMIAQSAARLCRAANCTFWRVENGMVHYCASYGFERTDFEDDDLTPMGESVPIRDNTLIGQVVKTRSVARIEDGTAASYLDHAWVRAHGLRHLIGVPIFVGDDVWGSINLMWRADQSPRDEDIQLVESFAAQASIAIENARQFRQTQQTLVRETASADILRVISQSTADIHPVFDLIARKAAELCGASFCTLDRFDGDGLHLSAQHGFKAKGLAALLATYPMKRTEGSISFKAIDAGTVAHIEDAQSDSYFDASLAATVGFHHLMGVPIRSGGRIWGVIGLGWPGKKAPTSEDVELIQTFADQASIAIENARLFTEVTARTEELTEALEQQTATAELLKVISRSVFDLPTVLQAVIETAARLCDATICILFNRIGDAMHMGAHVGCSPEMVAFHQANPNPIDRSNVSGRAALDRATIHVPDITKVSDYALTQSWRLGGWRSIIAVPLLREGEVAGVLALSRPKTGPFSARQIELVESFAAQAVIAINNASLFSELQARTAEVTEALEYQTATSDVLDVISRSPNELRPVLEAILDVSVRLCEPQFAYVALSTLPTGFTTSSLPVTSTMTLLDSSTRTRSGRCMEAARGERPY